MRGKTRCLSRRFGRRRTILLLDRRGMWRSRDTRSMLHGVAGKSCVTTKTIAKLTERSYAGFVVGEQGKKRLEKRASTMHRG